MKLLFSRFYYSLLAKKEKFIISFINSIQNVLLFLIDEDSSLQYQIHRYPILFQIVNKFDTGRTKINIKLFSSLFFPSCFTCSNICVFAIPDINRLNSDP